PTKMYSTSLDTASSLLRRPGEPAHRSRVDVVVDVLGLAVFVETVRSEFPPDAGFTEAAPFGLRHVRVKVVDPHGSVTQSVRHPLRTGRVVGPHRARKTVVGVVLKSDGLGLVAEPLFRHNGTEDFLTHGRHVGG